MLTSLYLQQSQSFQRSSKVSLSKIIRGAVFGFLEGNLVPQQIRKRKNFIPHIPTTTHKLILFVSTSLQYVTPDLFPFFRLCRDVRYPLSPFSGPNCTDSVQYLYYAILVFDLFSSSRLVLLSAQESSPNRIDPFGPLSFHGYINFLRSLLILFRIGAHLNFVLLTCSATKS